MPNFRFVFAADAHTGRFEPGTKSWQELLKEIQTLDPCPEFIIFGGDMVETGMDWEYEIFKETIEKLPIPIYPCLGNHETRWTEDLYQSYIQSFYPCPRYYSFDFKGIHFVILDSTIYAQAYGHIETNQLKWLKKDLESLSPEDPVVIVSHHPLAYPTEFTDNWDTVFRVCEGKNLALHLSGHGHSAVSWNFENLLCLMAPAVMSRQYLICDVVDKEIKIWKKTLGEEPVYWCSSSLNNTPQRAFNLPKDPQNCQWQYKTGGAIFNAVALGENEVCLSSSDGALHCLNKKNGELLWKYQTEDMLVGEPLITSINHRLAVVFTAGQGAVFALRIADGKLIWQHTSKRALCSSPNVYKNHLYFGEAHGFSALDLNDGKLLWKKEIDGLVNVKPAVDDSGIYFGAWDKKFYALSHDGQVIWQKKITENYYFSPSTGNPQISDDVVVFTSSVDKERGGLMALKKDTGEELWTKPILANYCTPLIHNGVVYVTDLSGKVYAFLLASGKELWTVNLENEIFSGQPLYYKEKIIVNMLRKSLAVIDLKTLEYKTIDVTRNYLLAAPRTDGQMVFIGAFDDKLHALKI